MDWSEAVRKAAMLAQEKGYVTFDELNQLVPRNCRAEDIETLMSALSEKEIWLQEE